MENKEILQQVKSLEIIINNLNHILGSDELGDLQYHLEMIKKLSK
jgi:hypothetical protein